MTNFLHIHQFKTFTEGKRVTLLGSVHGDEKCGEEALTRLAEDIYQGRVKLVNGTVNIIPKCNPLAFEKNVRFTERNLNRRLYPKDKVVDYEDNIDPILCEVLERTDILLDIHSYSSRGGAFAFLGTKNQDEIDFTLSLGVSRFVHGWAEAYSTSDDSKEGLGTTDYVRLQGGIGATLECGNHATPENAVRAYNGALYALKYAGVLADDSEIQPQPYDDYTISGGEQLFAKMETVIRKEKEGKYAQDFIHFDKISKGEDFLKFDDGELRKAEEDYILILPKEKATVGNEWIYIAKQTQCPEPK